MHAEIHIFFAILDRKMFWGVSGGRMSVFMRTNGVGRTGNGAEKRRSAVRCFFGLSHFLFWGLELEGAEMCAENVRIYVDVLKMSGFIRTIGGVGGGS